MAFACNEQHDSSFDLAAMKGGSSRHAQSDVYGEKALTAPRLAKQHAQRFGLNQPFNQELWRFELQITCGDELKFTCRNRIRVQTDPYAFGTYAEGADYADLAVTDGLSALLKPEFRTSFRY